MTEFVAAYPGIAISFCGLLVTFLFVLYKMNNNLVKGEKDSSDMLIAEKLNTIVEKLNVLLKENSSRREEIDGAYREIAEIRTELATLQSDLTGQEKRCSDRHAHCPGEEAKEMLRGVQQ